MWTPVYDDSYKWVIGMSHRTNGYLEDLKSEFQNSKQATLICSNDWFFSELEERLNTQHNIQNLYSENHSFWLFRRMDRPFSLHESKLPFQSFQGFETVNSQILQSQILESFCILKSFWILKPNTIQNTICYVPLREITWIKLQFKSRYTIWL